MTHFFRNTTLLATVTALSLPTAAEANVVVSKLSNDADPVQLASFKSASCRKSTKKKAVLRFYAKAKSSGYTLSVNIYRTWPRTKTLEYGGDGDADFTVSGPGGSWSNLNRPPNAPPGGGAIAFNAKRTRMGLGFSPAFNQGASSGVSVAGGLTCKYPRKKKKR